MENQAVSGTKKPLFGGRKPLFTQKELLLLTGPLLVEQLLEVTVGMADTMMVSRCGEAAISGVSLVDMINNLIIVLFAALATGGAVVVSQFLGAREQKEADASSGQLLLLSGVFGLLVGAFCFVFARPMIRLFYGAIDADVLDASVLYLRVIAISYPFLALYNGGAALFRSMGNSKISMQISFLMNVINIVGNAVCIFGFKMGVDGVAWPSVLSRVVAAALILRKWKLFVFVALTERHHALAAVKGSAALPLGTFSEIHPKMTYFLFRSLSKTALISSFSRSIFSPRFCAISSSFLVASAAGMLRPSGLVKHPCGFMARMV